MHLTRRDHGSRLERFHDIRPARRRGARCGSPEPGSARSCTRPRDHRGPHAAHGVFRRVLAIWDSTPGERRPSEEARAHQAASREARALREETEGRSLVVRSAGRVLRTLASPEELAMVILFLGLVAWGLSVAFGIVAAW